MVNTDARPVRHEVWPLGWGRYQVRSCDGLEIPGWFVVAVVWGRRRAIERARALQRRVEHPPEPPGPVFRTDEDALAAFVRRLHAPPKGPAPGAPGFGQQRAPGAVDPPRPAAPPPSRGRMEDAGSDERLKPELRGSVKAEDRRDGTGPDWRIFGQGAVDWLACVRFALKQSTESGAEYSIDGVRITPPTGPTWLLILLEAVFGTLIQDDPEKLRAGLVRVDATVMDWIVALDLRGGPDGT